MKYESLIKKIDVPKEFNAPTLLQHEDLVARPLSREDLLADMAGVNSSIEIIKKTRGGLWPSGPVTEDADLLDLAWHEREFRDRNSFAYVIYDKNGKYIGCFYLYGMGYRTILADELIDYQVDASWWVTADSYDGGYYKKVHEALAYWLSKEMGFKNIYFSNLEQ